MSIAVNKLLPFSFITLSNAFVFPKPEPPIISILYGWSGIYDNFKKSEKITKTDKEMVNDLDYADIKFPVSNKDYSKIQ